MIRVTPNLACLLAPLVIMATGSAGSPLPVDRQVPSDQSPIRAPAPAQGALGEEASVVTIHGYANREEDGAESAISRSFETAEILAALPAAVRESLQTLSEHEQQVIARMFPYAALMEEAGFTWSDFHMSGALASDGANGEEFVLPRGTYAAIGVCDNDCTDIDVVILDAEGNTVAVDRELDGEAAVGFEVRQPATYTVGAHVIECSTPDCVYYVQLFKE